MNPKNDTRALISIYFDSHRVPTSHLFLRQVRGRMLSEALPTEREQGGGRREKGEGKGRGVWQSGGGTSYILGPSAHEG